jgi:hypothetical protein
VSAAVGDYAFLSDCQTAAVVDGAGSVDWWPGQSLNGPSVFTRLLAAANPPGADVEPAVAAGGARAADG